MADNGELITLAPGIERFGEDEKIDQLIRKYGYFGRKKILQLFNDPENQDLRDNMSAGRGSGRHRGPVREAGRQADRPADL